MKKLLVLFILLTLFSSGCGSGLYDLNLFTIPDDAEFLALVQELDTPKKICQYMLDNFTYEIHDFYTLDPYTLWQTKKGDCNDYASLGIFIANYHNYETYQIAISYSNTLIKHMLAVYVENNFLSFTDTMYYFSGFKTFKEIVIFDNKFIPDKKWSKYIVYDYWNDVIEQATK